MLAIMFDICCMTYLFWGQPKCVVLFVGDSALRMAYFHVSQPLDNELTIMYVIVEHTCLLQVAK